MIVGRVGAPVAGGTGVGVAVMMLTATSRRGTRDMGVVTRAGRKAVTGIVLELMLVLMELFYSALCRGCTHSSIILTVLTHFS
jgi:hypothetical protein